MRYDFPIIDFLSNKNALLVKNESEYKQFHRVLLAMGMGGILSSLQTSRPDWNYWINLAKLNGFPTDYLIFEYRNDKGLTFGMPKEYAEDWYGTRLLTVEQISNHLIDCKLCVPVNGGNLVATAFTNNAYPSCTVEFVPDTENEDILSYPCIQLEYTSDKGLVGYIWDDPEQEDFSKKLKFKP